MANIDFDKIIKYNNWCIDVGLVPSEYGFVVWEYFTKEALGTVSNISTDSTVDCIPTYEQAMTHLGMDYSIPTARLWDYMSLMLYNWVDIARLETNNRFYYMDLLSEIGESIGNRAYVADDGSISDSVLNAKLPELVKELIYDHNKAMLTIADLREALDSAIDEINSMYYAEEYTHG